MPVPAGWPNKQRGGNRGPMLLGVVPMPMPMLPHSMGMMLMMLMRPHLTMMGIAKVMVVMVLAVMVVMVLAVMPVLVMRGQRRRS